MANVALTYGTFMTNYGLYQSVMILSILSCCI